MHVTAEFEHVELELVALLEQDQRVVEELPLYYAFANDVFVQKKQSL